LEFRRVLFRSQGLTGFFASWITSGLWGEFLTLALLCVRGSYARLPISSIFSLCFPSLIQSLLSRDPLKSAPTVIRYSSMIRYRFVKSESQGSGLRNQESASGGGWDSDS